VIYIYNYFKDGYFKCDGCNYPLWEGDKFLRINGKRYCENCIQNMMETANWYDSSEADYINQETHEKINERK